MSRYFHRVSILVLFLLPALTLAQKPEKQISFARESKPHSYYVQQAELWWKEIQKDSTSEENWYNYFRANRNAFGSGNWKDDVVKESPYLRPGPEIVKMMEQHIPNTFTYYYLSYLDHGVATEDGDKLLKAYRMNPNFEGIHSSVISYAISTRDTALRKEVNKAWYKTNYISPNLLNYGYNVLMSLEKNAILLTQNDNDTYPLWMLQDALGVRPDVSVINIDFLLLADYRDPTLKQLDVQPLDIQSPDINEYEKNWQKIVHHILLHHEGPRPVYLGMTLFQDLYSEFSNHLSLSGLTFKYTKNKKEDLTALNRTLFEKTFLLDYLTHEFFVDINEGNAEAQNMNYLNMLKDLYDDYTKHHQTEKAASVKTLAFAIVDKTKNEKWEKAIRKEFK